MLNVNIWYAPAPIPVKSHSNILITMDTVDFPTVKLAVKKKTASLFYCVVSKLYHRH